VPPSFTPHLTLGRWKRPPSFSTVQRVLQEFPREGGFQSPWIVREVLLIRSQLTPRGSLYTPLATIPLRGAKGFNIVM
jgi:2'-5' RNA ligase